tara:strand:+ start:360 stop:497 length:138 start_codon:yes stop_codon:yes gene_type:complete
MNFTEEDKEWIYSTMATDAGTDGTLSKKEFFKWANVAADKFHMCP